LKCSEPLRFRRAARLVVCRARTLLSQCGLSQCVCRGEAHAGLSALTCCVLGLSYNLLQRNMASNPAKWRAVFFVLILAVAVFAILHIVSRSSKTSTSIPATRFARLGDASLYPPEETSGAIDDRVTQGNIHETICVSAYAAGVRPSSSFTSRIKHERMQQSGLPGMQSDYELDHVIPLELGGCPDCMANLWMESWSFPGAHEKDRVENYLHREVCADHITLADAQNMITQDWYAVYVKNCTEPMRPNTPGPGPQSSTNSAVAQPRLEGYHRAVAQNPARPWGSRVDSFSRFVSEHVPWLWPFLAWCLAILGALVLLAIPSYFVIFPIARSIREAVRSHLDRLTALHANARQNRSQSMQALLEDFSRNSGISCLSERSARLEAALSGFSVVAKRLSGELKRFLDIPQTFESVANRLRDASAKVPPKFPELPTHEQLSIQHDSVTIAKLRLVVSSVILVALIGVNTGMLSQILRGLDFIPRDLVYFGIPLYLVFALFLTLLEAGVGVVHMAIRPTSETQDRVSVGPLLAIVGAVMIACVEGFFYSQIAPNRESLFELPMGYRVKPGSLFFLWGATLVLILFALGSIWQESLERIFRSREEFPGLTRRLSRYQQKFAGACERAEKSAGHMRDEVETARAALAASVEQGSTIAANVGQLRDAASTGQLEVIEPHQLTSTESYQLMQLSGLWLVLTLVAVCIVVGTAQYAVGYAFSYLPSGAAFLSSLGIAASFLVIGLLLPRGDLILDGTGNRRLIVSASLWKGRTAVTLLSG